MNRTVSNRLVLSALAASAAPYAFYLLLTKRLRPTPFKISFSEADLYDDLFEGELAASTL